MKIYEIDTKHLDEDVARGKTVVKMVLLEDVEKVINEMDITADTDLERDAIKLKLIQKFRGLK